ncbi:MAG: phosphopyruvate hydratase [Candidatus Gracilibacteria bacterium]|jgi:enolase|nr:phosphopyruvate hydratase [Candidatus Gracilibacteria bacterium]
MDKIQKIHAREVLDSRGNPTIEVEIFLTNGLKTNAIVPSGASTGSHEAVELRDGDLDRYLGKGVLKAISNVNTIIADAIEGMDPTDQEAIDQKMIELDGTKNKSKLGANAILGVSLAVCKIGAMSKRTSLFQYFANITKKGFATKLPTPFMNIINGGAHADSGLEIQEFMLVPTGAADFSEALKIGAETFHNLKKILKDEGHVVAVGDEGGFAPHLKTNEEAIEIILKAAEKAGHKDKVKIALDVAANEFYDENKKSYIVKGEAKTADDMVDFYTDLANKYPIISIEDPFIEDDFESCAKLTAKIGDKVQIVGDDLLVTNIERIAKGIDMKAMNAVLIKFNQIGTITETIKAIQMAHESGWEAMVSHRSGETEDTTIADLCVGLSTGQIKTGSLCRSERIAKYNQLLRIEESLSGKATYQGEIK